MGKVKGNHRIGGAPRGYQRHKVVSSPGINEQDKGVHSYRKSELHDRTK